MSEVTARIPVLTTSAPVEPEVTLGPEQARLIERYHQATAAARFVEAQVSELRSQILAWGSGPSWVGTWRGRPIVEVKEVSRYMPSLEALKSGWPEVWAAVLREQRYTRVHVLGPDADREG